MKYFKIIFTLLIIILSLCSCSKAKSGDTPYTQKEKQSFGLVDYENSKYNYRVSYPKIYTKKDKAPNGLVLKNDESILTIWAEENTKKLSLEESYNEALNTYSEPSTGGIYKHCYCFNYKEGENLGYYYVMLYNNTFYRFTMVYPSDKADEYKNYYQQVEKFFLILE